MPPAAYTAETIKCSRWLLGQGGSGTSSFWKDVEKMDRQKQTILMERMLFAFSVKRKQVKHVSTARMNLEQFVAAAEVCCLLGHTLDQMARARGSEVQNPEACAPELFLPPSQSLPGADGEGLLFQPEQLEKARRRAIEGCLVSSLLWVNVQGFVLSYVITPSYWFTYPGIT